MMEMFYIFTGVILHMYVVVGVCSVMSQLFATPMDCQAPLFMGFSRQEYWSGLPFPSPEDLPNPGIESVSLALASEFFTSEPPGKPSPQVQT